MIYITGDTHGNFRRFEKKYFSAGPCLCKQDYVIVCGDFGIWDETPDSTHWLDWLNEQPFTTLFVDGNHENFDLLHRFPIANWQGGRVHQVRKHILHLMRGQIFEINGLRFFTMGGATSHDIADGILEPDALDFAQRKKALDCSKARYRINHLSWWQEEMPSEDEYKTALHNLEKADWKVNCILTHSAPSSLLPQMNSRYTPDPLTNFLETIKTKCSFDYWFFGHYHDNRIFDDAYFLQWEQIIGLDF